MGFGVYHPRRKVLTRLDTGFLRSTERSLTPTERHLRVTHDSLRSTEGPPRQTDCPLRPIHGHIIPKEDILRPSKGPLGPTLSPLRQTQGPLIATEDYLGPKMSLSDRKRVLSGRQTATKRGLLRPIEGSLRLRKDTLRSTQNLKSNRVPLDRQRILSDQHQGLPD